MYFADLSPCAYGGADPGGLAVGWLDYAHNFSRGTVPEGFVERLIEICKTPAVIHRGYHVCEFCEPQECSPKFDYERAKTQGVVSWTLIRVIGEDGTIYYSPAMICHYVTKHGYQPPEGFVAAVVHADLTSLQ